MVFEKKGEKLSATQDLKIGKISSLFIYFFDISVHDKFSNVLYMFI